MDSSLRILLIDGSDSTDLPSCSRWWGCRCSSFDNITLIPCRKQYSACEIAVEVRNDPLRFHLDSLNSDRNCYTQSNCSLILDRIHEQLDRVLRNIDIWESVWKITGIDDSCASSSSHWKNDEYRHLSLTLPWKWISCEHQWEQIMFEVIEFWLNSWTEEVTRAPMFLSLLLKVLRCCS